MDLIIRNCSNGKVIVIILMTVPFLTVDHSLIKYYGAAFRTIGDDKLTHLSYITLDVGIR